mmetsp:Transcript_114790/g.371111  ORF Transcript_114790/g.371111 Transcript_114790/m.371111 type:complete len:80 (-) Transcript_114790:262-501(-)
MQRGQRIGHDGCGKASHRASCERSQEPSQLENFGAPSSDAPRRVTVMQREQALTQRLKQGDIGDQHIGVVSSIEASEQQ